MFKQKQIISYGVLICAIIISFIITARFLEKNKAESNKNKLQFFTKIEKPYLLPTLRLQDIKKQKKILSGSGRSDFKKGAVVLNIWATWCAPCLQELPMLDKLYEKARKKNIEVLAVSISKDTVEEIDVLFENINLENLAVYSDLNRDVRRYLKVGALPVTFVINADLMVVARVEGALEWDNEAVLSELVLLSEM